MPGASDHVVLYDADCGFCTRALDRIMRWDRRRALRATPIQSAEGERLLASLPRSQHLDSWHLVDPAGRVFSAGAAGPRLLRLLPGGTLPAALLAAFPAASEVPYRWVAAHRELLGRFFTVALALLIVGCGTTVSGDAELTVYLSAPLSGEGRAQGILVAAGAGRALEDAGGEAGGAPVNLELLDSAATAAGWSQAEVAANARQATQDSTTIAYIGELDSDRTRVSAPITNEAGVLQVAPGPVAPELLSEPGGNDVPTEFQPTGERTLGALQGPGSAPRGSYRAYGYEAMAAVLGAIDGAEDPLSRSDVVVGFLGTSDRSSRLGSWSAGPDGLAVFGPP